MKLGHLQKMNGNENRQVKQNKSDTETYLHMCVHTLIYVYIV